jgi:hypothetical protein
MEVSVPSTKTVRRAALSTRSLVCFIVSAVASAEASLTTMRGNWVFRFERRFVSSHAELLSMGTRSAPLRGVYAPRRKRTAWSRSVVVDSSLGLLMTFADSPTYVVSASMGLRWRRRTAFCGSLPSTIIALG